MMFPNLNLPYRGYEFRVGASPQSDSSYYIRNYSLNYDFEKERGKISFRFFDKDGHGNNFYMEVPEQLQIIDYSLSDPNILDCNINEEQRWHIFCEYKERLKEQISFVINISGKDVSEEKFQPNGLFIFGDIRDFTLSDNKGYEKNNVLLNFNLGNRYKCKENCFIKEMSSESLDYYLDGNNLIVYSYQGENNVILPHFRLNTYNFHWQVWSGAIFVFTISLLASSIVLFFQEINLRKLKPFILKMKSLIKGKLYDILRTLKGAVSMM